MCISHHTLLSHLGRFVDVDEYLGFAWAQSDDGEAPSLPELEVLPGSVVRVWGLAGVVGDRTGDVPEPTVDGLRDGR